MALQAEREIAEAQPKRKKHYTGNAPRTKRFHAQKRRELEATGQKSITAFFGVKPAQTEQKALSSQTTKQVPEVTELDSDDEVEIVERLNRIFEVRTQNFFVSGLSKKLIHI